MQLKMCVYVTMMLHARKRLGETIVRYNFLICEYRILLCTVK